MIGSTTWPLDSKGCVEGPLPCFKVSGVLLWSKNINPNGPSAPAGIEKDRGKAHRAAPRRQGWSRKQAVQTCEKNDAENLASRRPTRLVSLSSKFVTSSTAQGGGGSFRNRKPIGAVGCFDSRMAERIHWWTGRWLELCFLKWLQWLQWSPYHNYWM